MFFEESVKIRYIELNDGIILLEESAFFAGNKEMLAVEL